MATNKGEQMSRYLTVYMLLVVLTLGSLPNTAPSNLNLHNTTTSIDGFSVIGLFTSNNIACSPIGRNRLVLQTTEKTVESYLSNNRLVLINAYLDQNNLNGTTTVEIVGPNTSANDVIAEINRWNQQRSKNGFQN